MRGKRKRFIRSCISLNLPLVSTCPAKILDAEAAAAAAAVADVVAEAEDEAAVAEADVRRGRMSEAAAAEEDVAEEDDEDERADTRDGCSRVSDAIASSSPSSSSSSSSVSPFESASLLPDRRCRFAWRRTRCTVTASRSSSSSSSSCSSSCSDDDSESSLDSASPPRVPDGSVLGAFGLAAADDDLRNVEPEVDLGCLAPERSLSRFLH